MRYVIKFAGILMVSWQLGMAEETLLDGEVRMCANGKRSYFGYCPEDVQKNDSRPPEGYTAPRVVVKRKRRPVNAGDCDASRPPEGGESPCPPKQVPITTGNLISGRYQDNGDGAVTDTTTNLLWKRCSEGQTWTGSTCAGEAIKINWNKAMPNAQQKSWTSFAGYSDWRVPTDEELKTLVYCSSGKPKTRNNIIDYKSYDGCEGEYQQPTIDQTAFPNTPNVWFWTATQYGAAYSGIVSFYNGNVGYQFHNDGGTVRLVRGGQ